MFEPSAWYCTNTVDESELTRGIARMMTKRKRDSKTVTRPADSAPVPVTDSVDVFVTPDRCQSCDSLERTRYHNVQTYDRPGVTASGKPYLSFSLKRTTCTNCGQRRIVRVFVVE